VCETPQQDVPEPSVATGYVMMSTQLVLTWKVRQGENVIFHLARQGANFGYRQSHSYYNSEVCSKSDLCKRLTVDADEVRKEKGPDSCMLVFKSIIVYWTRRRKARCVFR
jgi:hypothetical protein